MKHSLRSRHTLNTFSEGKHGKLLEKLEAWLRSLLSYLYAYDRGLRNRKEKKIRIFRIEGEKG